MKTKNAPSSFVYTLAPSKAHRGQVFMLAKVHAPTHRFSLSVPGVLLDRIARQVKGSRSTVVIALADWALAELERQGLTLTIEDYDPPLHWTQRKVAVVRPAPSREPTPAVPTT